MTPTEREYIQHLARQRQAELEAKDKNRTIQNDKFLNGVRTRDNRIPNMSDAYRKVRESGHTPTEDEIHFRRFTSGAYLDGSKNTK